MKTFSEKVYDKLRTVPKGKVTTYRDLARSVNSKAYRAVGRAMKSNKNPVKIPCFRVVKSSGEVGEYSGRGGVKEKIRKLRREGICVKGNKIIDFEKFVYRF
ncbi:MAG: MGMT family protein [Candidatus Woesearchaeota archaeon]